MKIGQMANYVSFIDDIIDKTLLIQLVSENKKEWRFRIDSGDCTYLTVSKKCGFDHSWKSGSTGQIDRRFIIEPY